MNEDKKYAKRQFDCNPDKTIYRGKSHLLTAYWSRNFYFKFFNIP